MAAASMIAEVSWSGTCQRLVRWKLSMPEIVTCTKCMQDSCAALLIAARMYLELHMFVKKELDKMLHK